MASTRCQHPWLLLTLLPLVLPHIYGILETGNTPGRGEVREAAALSCWSPASNNYFLPGPRETWPPCYPPQPTHTCFLAGPLLVTQDQLQPIIILHIFYSTPGGHHTQVWGSVGTWQLGAASQGGGGGSSRAQSAPGSFPPPTT